MPAKIAVRFIVFMSAFLTVSVSAPTAKADFIVDLAGFEVFGDFTATNNSYVDIPVFPHARITAAQWINLQVVAEGDSFVHELYISLNNSDMTEFWDYKPAPAAGQAKTYSGSGAFQTPADFGGPFSLLADGILRVTIWDGFDDPSGDDGLIRDAYVTGGTLRITAVPEPSSLVLISAAGSAFVGGWYRRSIKRRGSRG